MKKKTLTCMAACVSLMTLLLSGCSNSAPSDTSASGAGTESTGAGAAEETSVQETGGADSDVELTYWSMWTSTEGQAKIIQEAADAYEAATGIHINIEWKGRDVKTLIGPALDAGEKIDFFDTDYMILLEQNGKYLADLTEMATAAGYEEHVMPILLENAKIFGGDVLKAMPYQPYTTGVWYDKAMFEAAGITKTPETFDELLEVCQQLKDYGVNPMTCNSDGVTLLYGYQLARYIGQDKVIETLDNADWANVPEAKQAADDIYTLFERGYMSPYAPANYPEGQNEIGFGESCMILNASWIPNEINQNTGATVDWGFFPWPSVENGVDGPEASMVGGQGFGIVDASEHKQEAFDFLLTVVTGEYDSKMAEAVSSIPADTANTVWPEAVSGAEPYFKQMTKTYEWAVGLENNSDYKDFVQDNLIKLTKLELDGQGFIDAMSTLK